jgi:hypothetical protein
MAVVSIRDVLLLYEYAYVYLRLSRKDAAAVVKNRIKKKIASPRKALLLSVMKIACDFTNTKNPDGIRSERVL